MVIRAPVALTGDVCAESDHSAYVWLETPMKRGRPGIPSKGLPPPHAIGIRALLDLDQFGRQAILWLLTQLSSGRPISARAMAAVCPVRRTTAAKILRSEWRSWAEAMLRSDPRAGQQSSSAPLGPLQDALQEIRSQKEPRLRTDFSDGRRR